MARILLIEDNIVTLGDLELRLGKMGYESIETAVTGEEAIEIASKFKPEVILSDINLGSGINGIEAVSRIKEKQDVPVVYLTAYDDNKTLNEAGITEPYAYLLKPLQERELQIALSIAIYKHQSEKKIKEALALNNRFMSLISHDLKDPFNSILGMSELMLDEEEDFSKDRAYPLLKSIHKTAKNAFDLLNNLLDWSRNQRGENTFHPTKVNIHEPIYEAFLTTNQSAKNKSISLAITTDEHIIADIDVNMIKTVIRNLLSNAVKFTSANGQINISAKKGQDNVLIQIDDTGIGMNKKTRKNLFKIEESQSSKGTEGERGSGFGLMLCKEFVEKHGGDISVKSKLGKGSSFLVKLPLSQENFHSE